MHISQIIFKSSIFSYLRWLSITHHGINHLYVTAVAVNMPFSYQNMISVSFPRMSLVLFSLQTRKSWGCFTS